MKPQEFITESKNLDKLKRAIAGGAAPSIYNASYTADGYSWGDLRSLGLAQKESRPAGFGLTEEWWEYSPKAPGPITLVTMGNAGGKNVMQPGDKTDPIEVDYS